MTSPSTQFQKFVQRVTTVLIFCVGCAAIAFAEGMRDGAQLSWRYMAIAVAVVGLWMFGGALIYRSGVRAYADIHGGFLELRAAWRQS